MTRRARKERIYMVRKGAGLVPAYPRDADLLSGIAQGAVVSIDYTYPRRGRHHRWYWALCAKVAESHPFYSRAEQISDHLKFRLGLVDVFVTVDGQALYRPQSLSFESMGQDEFQAFTDRALDVIAHELLPGISREDLRAEIENMIEPEQAA